MKRLYKKCMANVQQMYGNLSPREKAAMNLCSYLVFIIVKVTCSIIYIDAAEKIAL